MVRVVRNHSSFGYGNCGPANRSNKVRRVGKMIYIFDIDGTLADCSHRLHLINKPADWPAFFSACVDDAPIPEVINVARALAGFSDIVMITGRSEVVRMETLGWLNEFKIPCHALYMRSEGDHRQDNLVKAEHLDHLLKNCELSDIKGVFEDRKQVVDMYRTKGLRVFQVAEGNF